MFFKAYDKWDHACLYEFLIPRVKHESCYIDVGEPFEVSCYDDVIQHVRYDDVRCCAFKELFMNYSQLIEGLILISYNSIQDYFDYKTAYNLIFPKHSNFCNVNASKCLYYSTEYDSSDYDNDEDCYEFAEAVQNDRTEFSLSYNDSCRINGVFDKFYSNQALENIEVRRHVL